MVCLLKIALFLSFLATVGCASPGSHTTARSAKVSSMEKDVGYSLDDVNSHSAKSPFKLQTLAVEGLRDKRIDLNPQKPNSDRVEIAGTKWYYNAEKGYKRLDSLEGVTDMMIVHLKHSGVFRDVVKSNNSDNSINTDYILEGRLKKFVGLKTFTEDPLSVRIATGVGGVAGYLVASSIVDSPANKTRYEAMTILADLMLTERKTGKVISLGTVEARIEGMSSIAGPGGTAEPYARANESLKVAMNKLTDVFLTQKKE